MEHKTVITPLNCAFGTGLNSLMRMEQTEYAADTVRSIYAKDPDISWFKMKSITATPYLEPAFFGLTPGDIIDVEFDALAISGNAVIDCRIIPINSSYVIGTPVNNFVSDTLKSTFKHFKARIVIPTSFDGSIGTVLNIRPSDASLNSEIIIKNIEVKIISSNPLFAMVNNITAYRTRTGFNQCIDYVSGMTLNPTYNGLKTVLTNGGITFPDDDTMQINTSDTTNFKGLMTCFNGYKYRPSIAVYAEYFTNGVSAIYATASRVSESGALTQVASDPTSFGATTLKKKIVYLNGDTTPGRKTLIDFGRISYNQFTMKNVRFSMPQFDDAVKRPPNQLEELYTNLSAKLR